MQTHDPRNQQAMCLLGECFVRLNKLDAAREWLDACIATNADFKRPFLVRGKLLASDYFKNHTKVGIVYVRATTCSSTIYAGSAMQ